MSLRNIIGFLKKGKTPWVIVITLLGGLGGFLYWRFVGCNTGTCPIRSVWYYSTLYGLVLGYLLGDLILGFFFRKKEKVSSGK